MLKVQFNRIPKLKAALKVAMPRELSVAATEITQDAKSASPKGPTGNLQSGWDWRWEGPRKVVVYNDVHYSLFHEYGTAKMGATPMLRPATDRAFPQFIQRMVQAVK